jgi:hypothetical protein
MSLTLSAQNDYISYYHLCRKAEKFYKEKKLDSASVAFQQAFNKVDYVHNDYLRTAAMVEKKKGNSEKAKQYLNLIDKHNNSINSVLKRQIDSLGVEDQRVRTNKYYKAIEYFNKCKYDSTLKCDQKKLFKSKSIMMDWWETDSLNIIAINKFIKKNGFPGERLVGKNTNLKAMVILLHYDKDTASRIMIDVLNKALMNGDLLPRDYAYIIDRHLYFAGEKQRYYTIAFELEKLTEQEKDEYNKNRASIGIGKLQDLIIIKRGNKTRRIGSL